MRYKTIGLCLATAGLVSICTTGLLVNAANTNVTENETVLGAETVSQDDMSVSEVIQSSMSAMVSITSTSVQNLRDYFGGNFFFDDYFFGPSGGEYESVNKGSGVIIGKTDDSILIATNNHVIDGAKELSVAFIDEKAATAEVLGASDENDIALIKVALTDLDEDTLDAIKVIPIGQSEDVVVGEEVIAIGNALGYGQSASRGIVSALNRSISDTQGTIEGLIQTDAAINPGNSGGALLNMKGELIGINCAKYASSAVEGMGYAIPIDDAEPILSNIANGRDADATEPIEAGDGNAHMGVTCVTISDDYANYYGIPTGAYISVVDKDSPAEEAGIKEGDIITKVDGTRIHSSIDLKNLISNYSEGDEVEMEITRFNDAANNFNNQSETLTVTVKFGVDASEVNM
jgi:serine protease Do